MDVAERIRDVAIVTDSTSDIPFAIAAERGVTVVPLSVEIGGEVFSDGELNQEEFFARMHAHDGLPKTSQPTPSDFAERYRALLERAKEVVSIHLPETVSGTIRSARQAASDFPDRVRVVDSHIWSGAMGLIVLKAQEWASSGLDGHEVAERVEWIRDQARIIIALDGLDNLSRGGRIGNAAALIGGILDVRVLVTIRDRIIQPVKKVRGPRKAFDAGTAWFAEQVGEQAEGAFCVMHALAGETADKVKDYIELQWPGRSVLMTEAGAVISTHTGTGWGAAFLPDR